MPIFRDDLDEAIRESRDQQRQEHLANAPLRAAAAAQALERAAIIRGSHPPAPDKWPMIAAALRNLAPCVPAMRSKATTIATNILIDAFRAGVFEHSKWYAWKQDLAAYPNFESAVSLLEKHAAELGIVVPAFRNHPWKYLLDGCPLMASLIERESAVNGHATSSPAGPAMLTPAQQADKLGLPMVLTGSAKRNKLTQRVRKHALKVGYLQQSDVVDQGNATLVCADAWELPAAHFQLMRKKRLSDSSAASTFAMIETPSLGMASFMCDSDSHNLKFFRAAEDTAKCPECGHTSIKRLSGRRK